MVNKYRYLGRIGCLRLSGRASPTHRHTAHCVTSLSITRKSMYNNTVYRHKLRLFEYVIPFQYLYSLSALQNGS